MGLFAKGQLPELTDQTEDNLLAGIFSQGDEPTLVKMPKKLNYQVGRNSSNFIIALQFYESSTLSFENRPGYLFHIGLFHLKGHLPAF